jgi:HEPN domain-containing protein
VERTDAVSLAGAHLDRARRALEAEDETAAVLWSNLCAEIAVAHVAAARGLDSPPDHFRRATLAKRLFELGALPEDLGDLMIRLNNERKHGVYEGRPPNLQGRSWAQVFQALERVVAAAAEGPSTS